MKFAFGLKNFHVGFDTNSFCVFGQKSLHFQFPACTMKGPAVDNLLETASLINYCNSPKLAAIESASHCFFTQGKFIMVSVEVHHLFFTGKGSGRGPCTILESCEQWLLPLVCEHSLLYSLGIFLWGPSVTFSSHSSQEAPNTFG